MSTNSVVNEIKYLCRVCLGSSSLKFDLRRRLSSHKDVSVLSALGKIMNCKVELSKNLPTTVCAMCMNLVELSYNLQKQFEESQRKLAEKIINETKMSLKNPTDVSLTEKNNGSMTKDATVSIKTSSEKIEETTKINKDIFTPLETPGKRSATDASKSGSSRIKIQKIGTPVQQTEDEDGYESVIERHVLENIVKRDKPIELKCKFCDFITDVVLSLRTHMKVKHFGEVFKCELCYFRTKDEHLLERHSHIHRKKHKCEFCKFTAETIDEVENHIDEVHYTTV